MKLKEFVVDYIERHAHPVNALLHLIGVPLAIYGLYCLVARTPMVGFISIILGYFLQYIGHKAQGNEVGEVILIKKCFRLIVNKNKQSKNVIDG